MNNTTSNTLLLLPLETDISDLMGHTVIDVNNNLTFTGPNIFGTPSAKFTGGVFSDPPETLPSCLRIVHTPDLDFSQYSEFTVEGFMIQDENDEHAAAPAPFLCSDLNVSWAQPGFYMDSGAWPHFALRLFLSDFSAYPPSTNDWGYEGNDNATLPSLALVHFAYVLKNGVWKIYLNGAVVHTFDVGAQNTAWNKQFNPLVDGYHWLIGAIQTQYRMPSLWCALKSFRVAKVAVYDGPFTPPTSALGII